MPIHMLEKHKVKKYEKSIYDKSEQGDGPQFPNHPRPEFQEDVTHYKNLADYIPE